MSVPFERCIAVTDDPSVLFRLVHVAMWNVQHWPRRAWRRCLTRPSSPSWPPRERRGLWKGDWGLAALTAVWLRDYIYSEIIQQSTTNQTWTENKRLAEKCTDSSWDEREDWKDKTRATLELFDGHNSFLLSSTGVRVAVYYQRSTKPKSVSSFKRLLPQKYILL